MDYIDFHLKIGPRVAENDYTISSRSSSIGETAGVFTRPLTDEQLELFVLKVGLARRSVRRIHSPEWRAAQDFGQKLFRALFTDEIRAAYLASYNDAVRQGKGLRIQLTLDAPELANYPWEFLYDPANSQFLSLFEDTPILRYIELSRPILPLTVVPPLRILAVASSPKDYDPLDLARERRNLAKALDPLIQAGLFELDWLPSATLEAVREQLVKRPYHIFHFIGHGGFDERQQDGVLLFENAGQYSNRVSGERLAVILGNHRTLRLAMLNACEGARTSEQDPFAGTAMTLVRTGNMPAVIAMQFEITDNAAIDFASGFYGAIASGRPVDAAVSQGRQAIFASNNDVEWSTPVLYLRAADGIIFNIDLARAEEETKRRAAAQAEQERLAREKAEQERAAAERAEQEHIENVRRAAAKAQAEREAAERAEQERIAAAKAEEERIAREKLEAERAAAEQAKKKRLENERIAQAKAEAERIAAAKAQEERIAREQLEAERVAAEQAEKERIELARLEAERVAAEQAEKEQIEKARLEQEQVAREKLEQERAAAEQAENERLENERRAEERAAAEQAEKERVAREKLAAHQEEQKRRATEKLDQQRVALEQAEQKRQQEDARREERQAEEKREAERIAAEIFILERQGKELRAPPPTFSPERTSPLGRTPGTETPLKGEPRSKESSAEGIAKGSAARGLFLAIVLLTLMLTLGTTGSYATSLGSDDQPILRLVALLFIAGALILSVMGVWVLGKTLNRVTPFNSRSVLLLEVGWLIGILAAIFVPGDGFGKVTIASLLIGASTAFALKVGNPRLKNMVLLVIGAAWVVGFVIQATIVNPIYVSATSDIWDWLHPLKEQIGWNPVVVIQIGITSLLFVWIAPLISTVSTYWLVRTAAAK